MRIVVVLALIGVVAPAAAAGKPSNSFKLSDVCTPAKIPPGGSAAIDRRKLVGQVLKSAGVADIDLDPDGGEIDFAMKQAAIVDPYLFCTRTKRCTDQTQEALGGANITLRLFIENSSKIPPRDADGFYISRARNDITGEITPRELMDSTLTGISARCLAATKSNGSAEGAGPQGPSNGTGGSGAGGGGNSDGAGPQNKPQLQFLVRKNVADLDTLQSSDAFKGLDRASLSIASDYLKSTYTYNINGVAGVGLFKFATAPNVDGDLVAYALYSRQLVAGQVPRNTQDVDNIGGGFASNFLMDTTAWAAKLQWSAQYLEFRVSDGKLWSTSLTYIPLTGPFIGRAEYAGPFAIVLLPQLAVTHGTVIDHGLDPSFVSNKDFNRMGGHMEAVVFFDSIDPSLTWLNGFSWRNIYDFYYDITGFYRTIDRFESKVSYKFPDQQYWSIDLDYINGRNLDSLQLQQQLTLGVGLKF